MIDTKKQQIKPFIVYQLEKGNTNARCCYESQNNKIICTVIGPQFDHKSTKSIPNIKIKVNGYEMNSLEIERLKQLLMGCIVLENYPKSVFDYNIQILQNSIALYPCIVNLLCYTNIIAGIAIKDIFCGSIISIVDNQIKLQPTKEEQNKSRSVIELTILKRSKKIINYVVRGECSLSEMQKMIGICLSSTQVIGKYLQQKSQKQIKEMC